MGDDGVSSLQRVGIFSGLDSQALACLARSCRRRVFPPREALFHEGESGQTLYIVLSGQVTIQKVTSGGETIHIAHCGPGEHFGEMALLDGEVRSADAVTDTRSELLILNNGDLRRCMETFPPLAENIRNSLMRRLREVNNQLVGTRTLRVIGRLSAFLLETAETQGVEDPAGGKRIPKRITQQQIANHIGATRETVSRALSDLRKAGAVRLCEGHLVIASPKKLRRYCEG
jgi:CRP/FNR family cyclic AMP-dependent transcriptional regulator